MRKIVREVGPATAACRLTPVRVAAAKLTAERDEYSAKDRDATGTFEQQEGLVRAVIATSAAGALALVLVACSGPVQGTPSPGGSTEISTPSQSDVPSSARAPEIAEPLTPGPFVSDACRAISADRAATLNLTTPGRGYRTPTSSACIWRTTDRQFTIGVSYLTTLTAGLSEIYAQHEKNPDVYPYFEPTTVLGYPALYADKIDERERGHCLLNIGVTDSLYAHISVNHVPRSENVCELAARAGEAVITTMKEGA